MTDEAAAVPFEYPAIHNFPPFFTLQPNLDLRHRQLCLWSDLLTSYCHHHRVALLDTSPAALSSLPFAGASRHVSPSTLQAIAAHMVHHQKRALLVVWDSTTGSSTTASSSSSLLVLWRPLDQWVDSLVSWANREGLAGGVVETFDGLLRQVDGWMEEEFVWRDNDKQAKSAVLLALLRRLQARGQAELIYALEGGGGHEQQQLEKDEETVPLYNLLYIDGVKLFQI
eukprot:GHVS01039703.1.p1 GENE.GHVS01039703.1~~GHVS01039703.1.p1  ORF type:complete len:227 (-),score=78.83 GHVS01039703.1:299-979(-)